MGRLVRRYIQVWHQSVRKDIEAGTWTVPITQAEAAQKPMQAVINANALGGDINAALLGIVAVASLTATLAAIRPRVTVNTGVTLTGDLRGINLSVAVLGTAVITGNLTGVRISIQNANTVTQTGDIYGIYIDHVVNSGPVTYEMIRCEQNGTAVPISILSAYASPDVTYMFIMSGAKTAWNSAGDKIGGGAPNANADGFIRVAVGGVPRFIQLFT